jgi:hypothetical protein
MDRDLSFLVAIAVSTLASCARPETGGPLSEDATPTLVGAWRSFQRGGKDINDSIIAVTEVFNADGTCRVTGQLRFAESTYESSHDGTYRLLPGRIVMTLKDVGTAERPYTVNEGVLTIHDPDLDSWIKYRKED